VLPAREIQQNYARGGGGEEAEQGMDMDKDGGKDEEEKARETFEKGISVEGEFAFTKAAATSARKQ
jgi:hypothetical protein